MKIELIVRSILLLLISVVLVVWSIANMVSNVRLFSADAASGVWQETAREWAVSIAPILLTAAIPAVVAIIIVWITIRDLVRT